jgi:hypothetical protein
VLSRGIQHEDHLRHIAVLFQIPAKDPDKAIRQPLRAPERMGQGQDKQKEQSKRFDVQKRIASVAVRSTVKSRAVCGSPCHFELSFEFDTGTARRQRRQSHEPYQQPILP